jgi:hypothetical protein
LVNRLFGLQGLSDNAAGCVLSIDQMAVLRQEETTDWLAMT